MSWLSVVKDMFKKAFLTDYEIVKLDEKIAALDKEDEIEVQREVEWGFNTNPILVQKVRKLIILAEQNGSPIKVTQAYRSTTAQDALYAKGRTKPGKKVTNAKGGQSWHNYGCAIDVCFKVGDPYGEDQPWKIIGALGESQGLEWGGRWGSNGKKGFMDRPHFQLVKGLKTSEAKALLKRGGLSMVWDRINSLP